MSESITVEDGALVRRAGPVVEALTPTPLLATAMVQDRGPGFLASLWLSMKLVDELVVDRVVSVRTLH